MAAEEEEKKKRQSAIADQAKLLQEMQERKEQMRKDGISPVPGGSL